MKLCLLISFIVSSDFISTVAGTGSMYDPPQRGVQWKYQFPVERNYNYMQLHCGGILVSHDKIISSFRPFPRSVLVRASIGLITLW